MLDNDVYCKLNKQFKKTKRSLLTKIIINLTLILALC